MAVKSKPKSRERKSPRKTTPVHRTAAEDISEQDRARARECPVVGFGASAGGLEAFTEVLQHIPTQPGFALVLVQHLDPKHSSILTELLGRSTKIPVLQAREGLAVRRNHVYVIPPNSDMSISRGVLHLEPRAPVGQHMPIDYFFRSLAQDQAGKAFGVILSGTASDGTLGLKAIKAEGGITFAQDVYSAKYDGMPRSAMAAGCVDFVLSPDQIARELISLCQHPYLNLNRSPETAVSGVAEDEAAFTEIFGMLRSATGVDFSSYKPGTIRRRTLRRMVLHKMDNVQQYAVFLRDHRSELQLLFQDILINVTGFFREAQTLEALRTRVFPVLFKDRSSEDPIRVWAPGCATGEEVYSIAICLIEYMRTAGIESALQIFGTDLSEPALERARAGLYPESIAADVSSDRLRRFFVRVNSSYQITRSVRDSCVFARQNVTKDPPFSRLDLILCRNVLIYLGPGLQKTVMRLFHYALRPRGFLVLGLSESIGHAAELFAPQDNKLKIYSRRNAPAMIAADFTSYGEAHAAQPSKKGTEPPGDVDLHRKLDQMILARHSPPALLVDRNLQILQFRGQTNTYLEHTPGEANLSLLKMTPSGLGLEVRKLIRKAEAKNGPVTSDAIPLSVKKRVRKVNLVVTQLALRDPDEPLFLVMIEEAAAPAPARVVAAGRAAKTTDGARTRELEQELASTREYLQAVIEEQEASSEELKSAHEEVQSGNEELQSTNEELLTAKEELQSTNEELTTVNEEMQSRNSELQQLNNDLLNLLSSVNIPIVMLGSDLRIRRFTPQAEKILNLLATDIGRPISDFRLKVSIPDLAALCRDVIDDLHAREREVQDAEGRVYSMWVRPYRTAENKIDGLVLALLDITERKQSAEARYRRLFEAAMDGIVIADAASGEIIDVNPFVTKLFGYSRSRLIGVKFWESDLFRGSGLDKSVYEELEEAESVQKVISLSSECSELIPTEVVCNRYAEGEKKVIQFNIRDVSMRRRMEEQLRREDEQLRQAQKMDAVGRLAGGVTHDFNNLLTGILGYCDLLQQDLDGNGLESRSLLGQIRAAGERAAMLTKQLLAFGRKQILQPVVLDLNEVVTEMQQLLAVTLDSGIQLDLKLAPSHSLLKADRSQLEQVILNLVLNARDAMVNSGSITVETASIDVEEAFSSHHPAVPTGKYVTLTVKDTGSGMDTETQTHLFEPFFTTKPRGKGAGLGLSTVYSIVKQADGHVSARSELGVGTTFTVYLPRVEPQEDGAKQQPVVESKPQGGAETILLVEDEPAIRVLARRFLEQLGYRVLEASGGAEAIRAAREYHAPLHLLLTDVVMPNMSGREVAFQIGPERPEMRVLYMSGHTEDTIAHHGILNEGVSFLQKPFTRNVLASKVREVLDGNLTTDSVVSS